MDGTLSAGLGKTVEMVALMTKNPPPPGLPTRVTLPELAAMPAAASVGRAFFTGLKYFCACSWAYSLGSLLGLLAYFRAFFTINQAKDITR